MANTTSDPERFRKHWLEHVGEFYRLASTLPADRRGELADVIDELEGLVETAAAEIEDDDLCDWGDCNAPVMDSGEAYCVNGSYCRRHDRIKAYEGAPPEVR